MLVLCEAAGGRLLEYDYGISQVGTEYQLDVIMWPDLPMDIVGDVLFRSIDVSIKHSGAVSLGVTPIVDDVDQSEQFFSGSGVGIMQCQAFVALRGTRIAARVRTILAGRRRGARRHQRVRGSDPRNTVNQRATA
jgi:hypothetical protein